MSFVDGACYCGVYLHPVCIEERTARVEKVFTVALSSSLIIFLILIIYRVLLF